MRAYAPVLVIAFAFICSGRSFAQQVENEGKAILEQTEMKKDHSGINPASKPSGDGYVECLGAPRG